jgi:hypothetical protein
MDDRQLMQQALDALELHAKQYPHMVKGYTLDAATDLQKRLAQPEQEPVAGVVLRDGYPTLIQDKLIKETDQRLYTTPPAAPVQEPACTLEELYAISREVSAEQARLWVGLTDDDVSDLCGEASSFGTRSWIRHIEAKLKEKNT